MSSLLFDQYQERLRRKGASPNSVRTAQTAMRQLDEYLQAAGRTAETATMGMLEDFFDQLPHAPSTKGTYLRYVQAAYNYGVKRGTLTSNPALDVIVPSPDPAEPRVIPNECLRQIKARIYQERDWVWFHLLAYTGMRRSEIRTLRWDDGGAEGSVLKLEDQTIRVLGKGRKLRVVPVHPALGEVLADSRREPGAFVVPSEGRNGVAMDTIMEMTRRLSLVYTPHDYRRTVATSLRRNGVDTGLIDRIMGWAPSSIFRRYYDNVADAELHRAILKLYADDPV
jgi:integrase